MEFAVLIFSEGFGPALTIQSEWLVLLGTIAGILLGLVGIKKANLFTITFNSEMLLSRYVFKS